MMLKNLDFKTFLITIIFSMFLSLVVIASITTGIVKELKGQAIASPEKCTPESVSTAEILKPGVEGETNSTSDNNSVSQPSNMGPVVFNTTGTITDILQDRVVVLSDGSSFADNVSRSINVIFSSQTLTVISGERYQGADGLKHLKNGQKILIGGEENIRGKTEFRARAVSVTQ